MEFQVKQDQRGLRNLYFGHPFSKETYTNSLIIKTPINAWETELDGIYNGDRLQLNPAYPIDANPEEDKELRIVRGTKVMFIGDYSFIQEMESDMGIYHDLCNKAMIKINNPEYLDFEAYTTQILGDPLKSIHDVTSVSVEQAKKYMEYGIKYDKDKEHSDKLILKPYFASCDSGVLILTDDFVDYNMELTVDDELGVIGCTFWMSDNTSNYTKHYKDI